MSGLSAGAELLAVDTWLAARLASDPVLPGLVGGRIHAEQVPEDGRLPAVVFKLHGVPADTVAVGGIRVMSRPVYQVKGIAQTESYADLAEVAERIDAALHQAPGGPVGDLIVGSCLRTMPIRYPETRQGIQYRHLGGLYRFEVYAGT